MDELPRESRAVVDGELAESVVDLVENCGEVEDRLVFVERAMWLKVAGCAIDEMRHWDAGVGKVGVIVDDGGFVNCAVYAEGEESLVPVDVSAIKN
jgi:hypothetical protein